MSVHLTCRLKLKCETEWEHGTHTHTHTILFPSYRSQSHPSAVLIRWGSHSDGCLLTCSQSNTSTGQWRRHQHLHRVSRAISCSSVTHLRLAVYLQSRCFSCTEPERITEAVFVHTDRSAARPAAFIPRLWASVSPAAAAPPSADNTVQLPGRCVSCCSPSVDGVFRLAVTSEDRRNLLLTEHRGGGRRPAADSRPAAAETCDTWSVRWGGRTQDSYFKKDSHVFMLNPDTKFTSKCKETCISGESWEETTLKNWRSLFNLLIY